MRDLINRSRVTCWMVVVLLCSLGHVRLPARRRGVKLMDNDSRR